MFDKDLERVIMCLVGNPDERVQLVFESLTIQGNSVKPCRLIRLGILNTLESLEHRIHRFNPSKDILILRATLCLHLDRCLRDIEVDELLSDEEQKKLNLSREDGWAERLKRLDEIIAQEKKLQRIGMVGHLPK